MRHLERHFLLRLRSEEIDGVDMVMLDADVAGCVETWLKSSSDLDSVRMVHFVTAGTTWT
jgi:hypothetical protein